MNSQKGCEAKIAPTGNDVWDGHRRAPAIGNEPTEDKRDPVWKDNLI